ncbi:hypothetical protein ABZ912_09350 [Nonomuraea angiospora]|uniref:hypothetical protein n=1 Tax=Nonomuraea angiospora TaxID=46172 RepID=UPI0033EEA926
MTNAWDAVRAAIDAKDASAVATLLAGYGDTQRREVARELSGYLPIARQAGTRRDYERMRRHQARWREFEVLAAETGQYVLSLPGASALLGQAPVVEERWMEPMRVAGAGAIAGAGAVATWLTKRDLERTSMPPETDDVPAILEVVAARPVVWQRDLAVRLALRLRGTRPDAGDRRVRLALELLRASGAEPPEHDPLTLAWAIATPPGDLAGDPLLDVMLPRLFETEGAGRALDGGPGLPAALAELAAQGRIRRASLLGGCRTRFLRGGQAADLRFFVRLHDLLDPAPEEVVPHAGDYAALLSHGPANLADLALRQLRRLKITPPAEAVEGLLYRGEARLVRAGLSLLDRLLKATDGDLDAYAPALAAALLCESAEARERAIKLAVKHAARFGPLGAETMRETVAMLPPGYGSELALAFGAQAPPEPEPVRFVPVPLPAAPEPGPMPSIGKARALARLRLAEFEWSQSEQWLDGFVRMVAGGDRDELVAELAPLAARCGDQAYRWFPWWESADWAAAMARELTEPGAERKVMPDGEVNPPRRVPEMTHGGAWKIVPLARFAEVYQAQLDGRLPPYLLATPTRDNGLLDARALVERLEGYERDGVTALPLDLRQALLRLSRTVAPEVAARAARLTGEAGRTVCRWLTDRPADPEVVLRWETGEREGFVTSEFVSGPEYAEVLGDFLVPRRHEEICRLMLPVFAGHRELVAARSLYTVMSYGMHSRPSLRDLELLTVADGPGGPGLALLLASYLLDDPEGGLRPLLHLAAAGDLPGAELGRQLAQLLRRGYEAPAVALAVLREAAEHGAHREVWQVMTGLLPAYLPGPGEKATSAHTRMIGFAAEVAEWADARGELAAVAELAGRTRESGLVRQARRLHARLTAASP